MLKTLFRKKHVISAPVTGDIVRLEEVNDDVFASGSMGNGVAINFNGNNVYSPSDGKVIALFPTGHALGIESTDGFQYIIHIGIDTVEMEGYGFDSKVKQGDEIRKGELLIEVDSRLLIESGYDPITMIVFPNGEKVSYNTNEKFIESGEDFIYVQKT